MFFTLPKKSFRSAMRRLLLGAVLALTACAAHAEPPAVTRFSDWELVCEKSTSPASDATQVQSPATAPSASKADTDKSPSTPTNPCKAMQKLASKDTGEAVFLVSVLPSLKPGIEVVIISAPLGGYLVPGMELHIDKKRPVRVLFETCNTGGCHGGFALSGAIRDTLMGAKQLQVRLWTSKSKPVDVAVSLNGFAQAVKALEGAAK